MDHKVFDLGGQLFHAAESAPTNSCLGDDVEPDFHLGQPGGIGGCVMEMVAGADRYPASHSFMFMGGVVAHHQMNVQFWRHIGLDVLEKF